MLVDFLIRHGVLAPDDEIERRLRRDLGMAVLEDPRSSLAVSDM